MNEENMCANSIEAEYKNISSKNAWSIVYHKIDQLCKEYPCNEAKKPENKPLNRYRDVSPYDHSRIILKRSGKDYINANLVKLERANRKYILTQGPLKHTVEDFWLMVWEQNSRAILMLNKIVEKQEIKCHWYWPQCTGKDYKLILNSVQLSVEQINEEDYSYYTIRVFRICDECTGESRQVTQFHYTTWPDFGVPTSPYAFLKFLGKVWESDTLEPDAGPAVVHCSAGIGRSGTLCLVDSCLILIDKEGLNSVKVQEMLLEMRKYRMGLIQTPDQLRFSYQAIIEGVKRLGYKWKEEKVSEEHKESIYYNYKEAEEEAPPPPPPRGESLSKAPARPLPAIPASASLDLGKYVTPESSSSEESPPATPTPGSPSRPASSADDEDDEPVPVSESAGDVNESLRRRRREFADRGWNRKRHVQEAEPWHGFKRSLYKPLTITFGAVGVLIAGVVIYSYVKR